ncbi:MAG: hypothetical protein IT431_10360 [Phycisphaerales bacterium]|nr:hypothetical protein [Phycisphaerales bacterium]
MLSARLTIAALLTGAGLTAIAHAQTTPSTPTTAPTTAAPTRGPLFLSGGQPTRIEPVRIARAIFVDGEVHRVGEWLDPPSGESRADGGRIFDCFGDSNGDRFMDDATCGLGPGRWYFGTGFCNQFVSNDMTLHPATDTSAGAYAADIEFAWTARGSGTSEQCVIGIFVEHSDTDACEPDSGGWGWLFDFEELPQDTAYYANLDLPFGDVWELPPSGKGSYMFTYLTDDGNSWATCAQPHLWGASNNLGADPNNPGEQGEFQLDDLVPPFGEHDPAVECRSYDFSEDLLCPEVLGAMIQFWGTLRGPGTEFRVEDGGNGHWYYYDPDARAASWFEARDRAAAVGGHLATVTDAAEAGFYLSLIDDLAADETMYLGGYQELPAIEPDQRWRWVTDEPFSGQYWDSWVCDPNRSQPDDAPGDAEYLLFSTCPGHNAQFLMADGPADSGGLRYIVEWDADCNGDGLVDYGQILRGELADDDGDGVPDICACVADFNFDGQVNTLDFLAFLTAWNAGDPRADIDADGAVDTLDILAYLNLWAAGC